MNNPIIISFKDKIILIKYIFSGKLTQSQIADEIEEIEEITVTATESESIVDNSPIIIEGIIILPIIVYFEIINLFSLPHSFVLIKNLFLDIKSDVPMTTIPQNLLQKNIFNAKNMLSLRVNLKV